MPESGESGREPAISLESLLSLTAYVERNFKKG
jgi:hypothetical protein